MGGMFGVVSRKDCVTDLFFGIDYHSHLELNLKMTLKECLEKWGLVVFQTMNLNLY